MPAALPRPSITGVILAGGQGRRMGGQGPPLVGLWAGRSVEGGEAVGSFAVGLVHRDRRGIRGDPLHEPGEHLARTGLDEGRGARGGHRADGADPVHAPGEVLHELVAAGIARPQRARIRVRQQRRAMRSGAFAAAFQHDELDLVAGARLHRSPQDHGLLLIGNGP